MKSERDEEDVLKGTTLKVYRFIYRQGKPMGIHDVQRGLTLSSPSVAGATGLKPSGCSQSAMTTVPPT